MSRVGARIEPAELIMKRLMAMVVLLGLSGGCSDDTSAPRRPGPTPSDILNAPVGPVMVDGEEVTVTAAYRVVGQGDPLQVLARFTDTDLPVSTLWFVSGGYLEEDRSPLVCFFPDARCVERTTGLETDLGLEFVVAIDIEDSQGETVRIRSELTEVEVLAP